LVREGLSVALTVLVVGLAFGAGVGCHSESTDDDLDAGALPAAPSASPALPSGTAALSAARPSVPAADAAAVFAPLQKKLAAVADAGRFCGGKGQPACPLQQWMKDHATTMLKFREISSLAEVFDQIAHLAPPRTTEVYAFPNWISIARDGAAATRAGELEAAKAACRGCHVQYRQQYKETFRGLPIPTDLLDAAP
jgi:hypothetical protein